MIWYKQIPNWLDEESKTWTSQQIYDFTESYIRALSRYTNGKIDEWDVLNEAIVFNGYRSNTWYEKVNVQENDNGEIGYLSYFSKLFKWAREENPDVEVVPLQQTQFQGVANIDDESEETSQSNVLKRRAILLAGDVASFFVFATIGRASHGEGLNPIDIVGTASPFILGWTSASYLLGARGAFGDCSRRSGVDKLGKILPSVGKTVLLGVPIGVVIRSVATFHVPEISFLFVSLGFNGVALLLWRVGVSADIRVGGDPSATSGAKKASKRGNPLEFLSLLKSLVTRW